MSKTEEVKLPEGALELLKDGIRVESYLQRHRKKFLNSGIAIIVIRIFVLICWLLLGQVINNFLTGFIAAGSLVEIVSASFLITMGCKPQRWLTGRILALSMFCAMGNISAGASVIYLLLFRYQIALNVVFTVLLVIAHTSLTVIFIAVACYAGHALRCSVCCSSPEDGNEIEFEINDTCIQDNEDMQNKHTIPNPFFGRRTDPEIISDSPHVAVPYTLSEDALIPPHVVPQDSPTQESGLN